MTQVKQEVRQFYDQVGWQLVGEDIYQNARYEDLRPVSREYIQRCHLRVNRHLVPSGRFLLDAGSGPIQYPEYLTYSHGYQYRVCADISITALREARNRIGEHGLFVVADIANLPFKPGIFTGIVSLHTIHHLPENEHLQAYKELYRVLTPGCFGVVVNSWPSSPLMVLFNPLIRLTNRIRGRINRLLGRAKISTDVTLPCNSAAPKESASKQGSSPKGTFTSRHDVAWMKNAVGNQMPLQIRAWRSVSVRFMRALIHPILGGRVWLRLFYWLESKFPYFMGTRGQYPLVIIQK
ncbi:class I SAM-dependent methyltransferase [Chloroflexota bacterium]